MNKVLRDNRAEIREAMSGLMAAMLTLRTVRDRLAEACELAPMDSAQGELTLGTVRALRHLQEAAQDVPSEIWEAVLLPGAIGSTELRERFHQIIQAEGEAELNAALDFAAVVPSTRMCGGLVG